ncbi:hypothetical protein [Mesoflavibacter zeaxanthinifaciens]|uniref:hypothetical protein n=1 Tax=Mesoflavibacter zeaxanthinifaciens TaxID=393060 RepID=UPI0003FFAD5C|nr:hypothetical protein [Mesoflavibacter zeaxanthinifaciens]
MYKSTFISLKKDFIRIYTGYRTESWLTIHSKPIYVLPLGSDESVIKKSLIDCFNQSREISQKEEDEKYYLGNELLKLLKEKSWKSSYDASTCQITYNNENGFILYFTKYNSKTKSSPIIKEIPLSIKSIVEINVFEILQILKTI